MINKKFKKIFVIVTDSLGVGELPDAIKYNDQGANTFGHILEKMPDLKIPTLKWLGINNILGTSYEKPHAMVGKMAEESVGKDTLTGHFELMGLKVDIPFPSFTDTGFPKELIDKLEAYAKRPIIGNVSASGTEIIKELGEEQLKTGALIVYTSADSVLQVAANETYIPLEELYDFCKYARKITLENPDWMVGRIIARPFIGHSSDTFKRTTNRHDYAVKPFAETTLDVLKKHNYDVIAIGKINDIFDGEGITESYKTKSNFEGMEKTIELLEHNFQGLCFTNLVDFDALYGHRRDVFGYGRAIESFDLQLKQFIDKMEDDTLLMVVADHGNDPIHHGTDHTREYVPLIIYYNDIDGCSIENQKSFNVVSKIILKNFNL